MNFRKSLIIMSTVLVSLFATAAMANEAAAATGTDPYASLSAALAIGLAAFGGAIAQGRTSAAALDGIARNPAASGKLFTPMILGLALIESLVIYSLIISFALLGKIH